MTILGAHVLAPDLAVVWADSEAFFVSDNRSAGMRTKLVINAAGFVVVMAGWETVAMRAASVVLEAPDYATALARLPGVLRRSSEQMAINSRDPGNYNGQHLALIGFDPEAKAMIAYRMTASACFVPELDSEQTVPMLSACSMRPEGPFQVQTIAERQVDLLREAIPHARGGPLRAVVIRPDSITINRLCDLGETVSVPEPVKEPA